LKNSILQNAIPKRANRFRISTKIFFSQLGIEPKLTLTTDSSSRNLTKFIENLKIPNISTSSGRHTPYT